VPSWSFFDASAHTTCTAVATQHLFIKLACDCSHPRSLLRRLVRTQFPARGCWVGGIEPPCWHVCPLAWRWMWPRWVREGCRRERSVCNHRQHATSFSSFTCSLWHVEHFDVSQSDTSFCLRGSAALQPAMLMPFYAPNPHPACSCHPCCWLCTTPPSPAPCLEVQRPTCGRSPHQGSLPCSRPCQVGRWSINNQQGIKGSHGQDMIQPIVHHSCSTHQQAWLSGLNQ
jgi:hypothetical protein